MIMLTKGGHYGRSESPKCGNQLCAQVDLIIGSHIKTFYKEFIHETSHWHSPKHIKYTKEIWQNTKENFRS